MNLTSSSGPAFEYRFIATPMSGSCPVCGRTFESSLGMWPHLLDGQQVCGDPDCPVGEEVTGTPPCDMLFEFAELQPRTLEALQSVDSEAESERAAADSVATAAGDDQLTVAERFRRVSLRDDIPDDDRNLLQLAAIDLQYCQAGGSRIERYQPRLVVRTCGEAAGELLLSGCGAILIEAS